MVARFLHQIRLLLFVSLVLPLAAQALPQDASAAASPQTHNSTAHKHSRKRKIGRNRVRAAGNVDQNDAPAKSDAPSTSASSSRQQAADQKLLKQQKAQSARAAALNEQQIQAAQQQSDAQQKQNRIQDVPGPTQTGVVPAYGRPVEPGNQRIEDAPGPAQTIPPPSPAPASSGFPSAAPATNSTPSATSPSTSNESQQNPTPSTNPSTANPAPASTPPPQL